MAKLVGYWKLETNENWEQFLEAAGVNYVLRKMGNAITSYEEIKIDGENWELIITSTFKNKTRKFKLGEEFDEESFDGRPVKTTFTVEGDILVCIQKAEDGAMKITREAIDDDTMHQNFYIIDKDVKARRIFKRYQS